MASSPREVSKGRFPGVLPREEGHPKDPGLRAHRTAFASPASPSIPPAKAEKILGVSAQCLLAVLLTLL